MKRPRFGGSPAPDSPEARDPEPKGPLWIEPIADDRGRLPPLPWLIVIVVVIVLVAISSRFVAYFAGAPAPSSTATPIAWLDVTAAPEVTTSPVPGAPSASPTALPKVGIEGAIGGTFDRGQQIRYSIALTNGTGRTIVFSPCPTYRQYILGGGAAVVPEMRLNCEAAGTVFPAGEVLTFEMVFRIPAGAPAGSQTIVWEARSGFQARILLPLVITSR